MTGMLRGGLRLGCAAAVVFAAGPAAAMQPASGSAPRVSPAPAASQPAPAAPQPAPAVPPGGPAGAAPVGAPPTGVAPPGAPQALPAWATSPSPWPPEGEQPSPKRVWYGWQHLLVLGGTAILAPIAVGTENEVLAWWSFSTFALGGPVTHWANGNLGKGFASLGLNAGCTLGGGMVGLLVGRASDSRRWEELAGIMIGSSAGLLTANIIDIAVLEREERSTADSYEYIRLRPPRLRLAPHVAMAPDRATLGLGGAF
ncbi:MULTISPECIES: hypothetical protein [Sorangium]|uniref:Uncharacterized protein n=1 Tax=Sorangium cellulosum TaxID=56 RepID=A0A4V0NHK5_SORCE|nr:MULTISPECIES: hypothetical protein [Sorangium]AUX36992.1 uncharacterized protein SOCE836_092110 [Sorangium cellulosum]WCQ96285.1 hypothetical protein NQZ70_09070 [Sorangium sp. Soce836]